MLKYPARTLLLFTIPLLLMSGCGSNNSSSPSGVLIGNPPVQAASGFTNASLTGGYAFGTTGTSGNQAQAGTGVAVADGAGNITSGEETLNVGGTVSCHATFTGTYSVNANGTGTATLTIAPDAASVSKGCLAGTDHLSLAIGSGGSTLVFAEQDTGAGAGTFVATAIKQ